MNPKKVPNDCTGQCDYCGKPLGRFKWVFSGSTGCTKTHAFKDFVGDDEWPVEVDGDAA